MRFLGILSIFFVCLYGALIAHYFSVNSHSQELKNIASKVKDVKISTSFISKDYESFVYAK